MLWGVNYLAVLVCGVIYFILGGLWYAAVFAKPWTTALQFTPEEETAQKKRFPVALVTHFIAGLLSSYAIAVLILYLGITRFRGGFALGLLLWVGFGLTISFISMMFERRPKNVFYVHAGFYLVAFLVLSVILAVWQR
jgi:ABC-type nickel/cobalt efflux system permease component RcnA